MDDQSLSDLEEKWKKLVNWYSKEEINEAVVAFSGGKDSTLILDSASKALGNNVKAIIVDSEVFPKDELNEAISTAEDLGVRYEIIFNKKLDDINFYKNTPNRCYICKKQLFESINQDKVILEGTNFSEIDGHRPGFKAVREYAKAPLVECELTGTDVRSLLKWRGFDNWDKPSNACLATRIPKGAEITKEKLKRIEKVEKEISEFGIKQLRVRDFGKTAKIEVFTEDLDKIIKYRDKIISILKDANYENIFLDLEGYRTGSVSRDNNG